MRTLMRSGILTVVAAPLAACATISPPPAAPDGADTACDAGAAGAFVGQKASEATAALILRASGARTLRWGPPDSAWTMDYRPDRVNVRYDRAMTILDVTCG